MLGFGWGKPVPFNPLNIRNKKWGPAIIGLAGPGSNFFVAIVIGLLMRFVNLANPGLLNFFVIFVWLNILLGVFNLIPVPPLDGSHILFAVLSGRFERYKIALLRGGLFSLFIAIFFMVYIGSPYIAQPLFRLITGLSGLF